MALDRSQFGLGRYVAAAVIGMLVLAVSVVLGVGVAVDQAVSADARTRAQDWAKYFVNALPDLDALLAHAEMDSRQKAVVATAAGVGNVFRFKLYNRAGEAVLQSDSETFDEQGAQGEHLDDEAFEVAKTHQPMVSLNDGTKERGMPALYAEAYVPVLDEQGDLRAITEAYVDETKTAAFFKTSFATLAVVLGAGIALAFGIPALAYLVRTKQAREVKHRAEFLASHDPVTSLLNRTRFSELLSARIADRTPGRQLAIAFLDVDDFKLINDGFGHEAGDEFLKHVARSVGGLCQEHDFVARAGGDEFVVALTRASAGAVLEAVEAMMAAVRQPISARGRTVCGRVSAGIYLLDADSETVEDAMHRADLALYQSKIDGKNTVRLFSSELEARMRLRRELEQLVREATERGLFELHYQPLLDAGTRDCIGFEALLRLRDSSGAYLPPATFIPVAESMGLISQIGGWVIREATRTAATWPDPIFVSVNLSVSQFADGQLPASVATALANSGLAAGRLELEVTESLLMENTESVTRQLRALKQMGVSIAMDDFGTGYSSLGYLWQFGFDKLKIDRSFVAALDVDETKAREILDTIVTLAHKLEMRVTAEGIETDRQAEILASLACDQFQGFLYGRPAPVRQVSHLIGRAGDARLSMAG